MPQKRRWKHSIYYIVYEYTIRNVQYIPGKRPLLKFDRPAREQNPEIKFELEVASDPIRLPPLCTQKQPPTV